MGGARAAAVRLALAIALASGICATGADPAVRAEVRRPTLAPSAARGDPDVVAFNFSFDLHLTNESQRSFGLPTPSAGGGSVRASVLGADVKGPGDTWTPLFQGSWYGNGNEKYEPCAPLRPGAQGDIRGVEDELTLLRKRLASLGREPTIRLQITIFCRQPSGRVLSRSVTTDQFPVRLPDVPLP